MAGFATTAELIVASEATWPAKTNSYYLALDRKSLLTSAVYHHIVGHWSLSKTHPVSCYFIHFFLLLLKAPVFLSSTCYDPILQSLVQNPPPPNKCALTTVMWDLLFWLVEWHMMYSDLCFVFSVFVLARISSLIANIVSNSALCFALV